MSSIASIAARTKQPGRSASRVALWSAVALGFFVRVVHTLRYDFPLNDGGLFLAMTRDLQAAHYRLPAFTSYNVEHIPFAYPPLGFYLAGLLNNLTHVGLVDLLRFLPLLGSALGVGAFAAVASVLLDRWSAVAATVAYALVPRGFIWLVMGGGLTRSFSVLFALLALWQFYLMYTRVDRRHVVLASLLGALCVLSHLETAGFLVWSAALLLLCYGRSERGVITTSIVAVAVVLLTSPWWGAVLVEHGRAPFTAARQTGATVLSGAAVRRSLLFAVVRFGIGTTQEPLFPVIGVLGAIGGLVCVSTRRPFLPAWWGATVLLDARAFPTYAAIPLSLMAGVAIVETVWPRLRPVLPAGVGEPGVGRTVSWRFVRQWWTPAIAFSFLVVYATIGAATGDPRLGTEAANLVGLDASERAAMAWVTHNTPPDSRFLLITSIAWQTDRTAEWFPALTERASVATVQGTEWLPAGAFVRRQVASATAQGCAAQTADCLRLWIAQQGVDVTHIYVPRFGRAGCCVPLLASLLSASDYRLVYAGTGATVFEVVSASK